MTPSDARVRRRDARRRGSCAADTAAREMVPVPRRRPRRVESRRRAPVGRSGRPGAYGGARTVGRGRRRRRPSGRWHAARADSSRRSPSAASSPSRLSRKAARRIDRNGALLRHDADLLRQLDPAHRSRVHDGRRGRRSRAISGSAGVRRSSSPASTSTPRRSRASPPSRASSRRSTRTGSSRRGGRSPPASTSPTTSSSGRATTATSGSSRSSCSGSATTAATTSTRTSTRASTASAARRSRPRTSSSTGSAPEHDVEPEWIEERNWFFRLSAYQERLLAALRRAAGLRPPRRFGRTRPERSSPGASRTSRSAVPGSRGGSRSPGIPDQVAYVWADALVNYLSALTYARPGEDLVPRFWPVVTAPARRRTSSASTASTGPRCCSPPGTRSRASCSCTGTCC